MEIEKCEVSFPAEISACDNCICSACHDIGKVVRLKVPRTYYGDDGQTLITRYSNYWLCRKCTEKLVQRLNTEVEKWQI